MARLTAAWSRPMALRSPTSVRRETCLGLGLRLGLGLGLGLGFGFGLGLGLGLERAARDRGPYGDAL